MARTALSLTSQDWSLTGRGPGHPSILAPPSFGGNNSSATSTTNNNSIVDEVTERMVSLLLIRIVALVTCRLGNLAVQSLDTTNNTKDNGQQPPQPRSYRRASIESSNSSKTGSSGAGGGYRRLKDKMYMDYSTSTICRSALKTAREGKRLNKSKEEPPNTTNTQSEEDDNEDVKMMTHSDDDEHHDATPMTALRQYSSDTKDYSIAINSRINHKHSKSSSKASSSNNNKITGLFPRCITPQIIHQLRTYVHTICSQYHSPHKVPYHNVEHAYHVFLSANKLLDLMLCEHTDAREDKLLLMEEEEQQQKQQREQQFKAVSSTPRQTKRPKFRRASLDSLLDHRPTYGIKSDPLTQLAFLFSALVHDVDHTGISNRQLVLESDDLAILYNDQSVAEQRSLAIAFSVLKRGEFDDLRRVLFESNNNDDDDGGGESPATAAGGGGAGENEDWFKFRKLVIDLVLVTDIASPERTQIVKSKWKEAFGEVIVAEKMKEKSSRSLMSSGGGGKKISLSGDGVSVGSGKESSGPQQVGSSNRGEGNSNTINNSTTPAGDGPPIMAIPRSSSSRVIRRASLDSELGRMGSQRSLMTSDISLSSNPLTKDSCDNDDNDSTDARSIDISESSSISDMQSLDDDFDASVVSRTKMNFEPNNNGDNGSASGNSNPSVPQKLQQQQQPSPNKMAPIGPREQLARLGNRVRRSTGDLEMTIPEEITEDSPTRGRSTESKPLSRRRSTWAIRGRLSQSMLIGRDRGVVRARSEERRLGVRRALDLAGSTIVAYNNNRSSIRSSGTDGDQDIDFDEDDDWDEIDEFKATVVLEQMIRAADVAALLQDWNNVMKWSTRLYKELKNGFLSNRGEDPAVGWYDNQIKFFDFYIKPLAKNLGVMGVFDEKVGHSFVQLVKSNLARWIEDGESATTLMIKQDEKERGIKKSSGLANIDESESSNASKSSLDKSMESLGLGNAVAEVKLSAMSSSLTSLNSDTLSGLPSNIEAEGYLHDSFNSASTASTTNQSSTKLP